MQIYILWNPNSPIIFFNSYNFFPIDVLWTRLDCLCNVYRPLSRSWDRVANLDSCLELSTFRFKHSRLYPMRHRTLDSFEGPVTFTLVAKRLTVECYYHYFTNFVALFKNGICNFIWPLVVGKRRLNFGWDRNPSFVKEHSPEFYSPSSLWWRLYSLVEC